MYLLYNSFGFRGIYILVLIISSLIALVLFHTLLQEHSRLITSFAVTILTIYFSQHVFAARNQIFSFLVFGLEIYCLKALLINGKKRHFVFLLILALALVIFHDTVYILYFVMMLPYIAEIVLSKIWKLEGSFKLEYSNIVNVKYLTALIPLSFGIGFFTPIFGTSYTNLINCMSGVSTKFIAELQPVYFLNSIFLTAIIFLMIGILCFTKTKVKVKDILFVGGLTIFSLIAGRNLFFLQLIGVIYCVNIIRDFCITYVDKEKLDTFFDGIESSKILMAIIAIIIIAFSIKNFSVQLLKNYVNDIKYPIEEVNYIKENLDYKNMRLWNGFDFGSYLELNGIKVFLDSRSGMYTKEENKNCTVLEDWLKINNGSVDYEDIFEKYQITHVLVENQNYFLNRSLNRDERYNLLYQSASFSLYERKQNN